MDPDGAKLDNEVYFGDVEFYVISELYVFDVNL